MDRAFQFLFFADSFRLHVQSEICPSERPLLPDQSFGIFFLFLSLLIRFEASQAMTLERFFHACPDRESESFFRETGILTGLLARFISFLRVRCLRQFHPFDCGSASHEWR